MDRRDERTGEGRRDATPFLLDGGAAGCDDDDGTRKQDAALSSPRSTVISKGSPERALPSERMIGRSLYSSSTD